ncbi:glycerol-3-phosphate responsive antiterminator [Tepidanaerobacter syntrophicus]|uniref:glycerol-3-phosphate responsive antiterminator n=1 Tax=Tepidanaerobacter syntrophicus TaxID=224999 RepID=UPI001BD5B750|nr:glycerol-3-phosphate responsive antiterminator [Tepidanaerobacter syntrophicus]
MTDQKIIQDLKSSPVIPAIRDIERVSIALSKKPKCIFLLTGNILNIKKIVDRVKESNKTVFLHLDLLEGISKDSMGIKYIAQEIKPDGIITTRANLINYAKNEGLFTIQRIFVLDSLALDTAEKTVKSVNPDAVEILPAVIPKVIGRICRTVRHPVIAGGLIENTAEVEAAIKEGAWSVSATKEDIWNYTF